MARTHLHYLSSVVSFNGINFAISLNERVGDTFIKHHLKHHKFFFKKTIWHFPSDRLYEPEMHPLNLFSIHRYITTERLCCIGGELNVVGLTGSVVDMFNVLKRFRTRSIANAQITELILL